MGGVIAIGVFTAVGLAGIVAVATSWISWWVVVLLLLAEVALLLAARVPRSTVPPFFRTTGKPKLAPELVLLPTVVSATPGSPLQMGIVALLAMSALLRQKSGMRQDSYATTPGLLLMVCVTLTFYDTYRFFALFIAVGAALWLMSTSVTRETAYGSLLAGMSLYLVANVAGWLAGIQAPGAAVRVGGYATSSGLFSQRILFPFSTSINASSYVAAALIIAVLAMVRTRHKPLWYHWVGVASGGFVIIGSNSRTPLIMAVTVAAALLLSPRALRAAAPWAVGASLLLPFLIVQLQSVAEWIALAIKSNSYLARGQTGEEILGVGGRSEIWSASIRIWSERIDDTYNQLLGFGQGGHVKSGAYAFFPSEIGGFLNDRTALSTHNSILQALYDTGLVGAAILFGVTMLMVYRYGRSAELLPIFSVALMLGLSGTAEVSLTAGSAHTPVYILLYMAFFMPRRAAVPAPAPAPLRSIAADAGIMARTQHRQSRLLGSRGAAR